MTEIVIPKLPAATGWGFAEVARRSGDFALAAVAATLTLADGRITDARIAMTGVGDKPERAAEAEALLRGRAARTRPHRCRSQGGMLRPSSRTPTCMPRRSTAVISSAS